MPTPRFSPTTLAVQLKNSWHMLLSGVSAWGTTEAIAAAPMSPWPKPLSAISWVRAAAYSSAVRSRTVEIRHWPSAWRSR